jgi:rhodanese-related sulfurtransferase
MKIVSKEQLEKMIQDKENIVLIDVLPKDSFEKQHIPGSISIPFKNNTAFVSDVEKHAPSKEAKVIVYCANTSCSLSKQAAGKLENAGFSNVYAFEEGVEGWFMKDKNAA